MADTECDARDHAPDPDGICYKCGGDVIAALEAANDELRSTITAHRERVKSMQWERRPGGASRCPLCRASEVDGHRDDCPVAVVLGAGEES